MSAAATPDTEGRSRTDWNLLTHDRLLGERLFLQTYVRLALAFAIALGAVVGRYAIGVDLDVPSLLALALGITAYNAAAWFLTRGHRGPAETEAAGAVLRPVLYGAIVLDYVALTVAIWLVGGARSPFLPFYLLHVILCCLLLPRQVAIFFHFLAYGLLLLFVLAEWSGVVPPHSAAGAVAGPGAIDGKHALTVLVVYGLLFLATAYLLLGFARMIRRGERQIRRANAELTRLSAMRRDFLSIAVHNLQSPVGVAITFLQNLRAGLGGPVTEKQADWIDRCLDRLGGLTEFMRNLQMLSSLESGTLETKREPVDVRAMLERLVGESADLAAQRRQDLALEPGPALPSVPGIEVLLREAVANLVTNALKYTPEGGRIRVRATSTPPTVTIEVEDDGPGIPEADHGRLFTEFFRGSGRAAGKDGSGLGLAIVRRVAQAHGGWASVTSRPGEGSRFRLELPAEEAQGAA